MLDGFLKDRFPGRIYDLNYETLTKNQHEETSKLLAYVGLDWEDGCLEFLNNKRAVQTASAVQVRQQMYQRSSEVWRNYEHHLTPMIELLREPVETD